MTRSGRSRSLVDAATAVPILQTVGVHFNRRAGLEVTIPGVVHLTFPVTGTRLSRSVMAAVDETGTPLLRYRFKHSRKGALRWFAWRSVEVMVSPSARSLPHVALVAGIGSQALPSYFTSPGGG